MVCIAAFIILVLLSGFVGFLSLFKRDLGKKYWKIFKKAWGCVWTRMRFKKCETNFKDDVKNSILKHFVLKKPKLVKPISVSIEFLSVLIVVVSAWSLTEAVKAGLALQSLGTCNVSMPSSCSLVHDSCIVDRAKPDGFLGGISRWFEEWGEIFAALPDSFKKWKVEDYLLPELPVAVEAYREAPLALDIIDPLCTGCIKTYRKQRENDFYKKYNTYLMMYPIRTKAPGEAGPGKLKYENSEVVVKYLYAVNFYESTAGVGIKNRTAVKLLNRIFMEYSPDFVNYQTILNNSSQEEAVEALAKWTKEFNKDADVETIKKIANSKELEEYLEKVKEVVEQKVKARGVPTLIYNGRKLLGAYNK